MTLLLAGLIGFCASIVGDEMGLSFLARCALSTLLIIFMMVIKGEA